MNDAELLIASVSLGSAFALGVITGSDIDDEFFPNAFAALFCLGIAIAFFVSLSKLVMNAL